MEINTKIKFNITIKNKILFSINKHKKSKAKNIIFFLLLISSYNITIIAFIKN